MSFRYYFYRVLEPIISRNAIKRHAWLKNIRNCIGYLLIPEVCKVQAGRMYLHKSGHSFEIAFLGVYEKLESEYVNSLNLKGKIAVDVGACIGYYSLILARKVGEKGRVFVFEPEKRNFEILRKNITLNNLEKNCTAYNFAVGEQDGKTSLRLHKSPGQHSINYKNIVENDVKLVSLDSIIKENDYQNVGFVKIDVEGYEYEVLKGMIKIMKCSPDIVILMEYAPQHLADYDFQFNRFIGLVESMGFKIEYWDLLGNLKKTIRNVSWLNDPEVVQDFKEGIKYSRNLILRKK